MIQRIQSIWLLLAAIAILCLLFVPVFTSAEGNIYVTSNTPLVISTVLAGLISLVNIFNFRNRKLQTRIASVNILLILGVSFWLSQLAKQLPGGLEKAGIGAGLFLPLTAIIFTYLAIKGIKNDEKLIRSADRLR